MTEPLLVYALTKINVGRGDPDRQDRADQRPYTGLDILAVKCTDHADPVTHKLIGEIRVTFVATGAVVYLPLPAGYADVGHTAVPAGYALAVDDEPETPAVQVADDLTGRVDSVHRAWRATYAKPGEPSDSWPVEVYEDAVIIEIGDEKGTEYQRYPYTMTDAGAVTFGDPEKVTANVGYTAEARAVLANSADKYAEATRFVEPLEADGRILESVDGIGPDGGRVWRITMVRPGVSLNGRRYRPEVLTEAAHLYEGAKAFDGHRTDAERDASAVRNLAGWHTDVAAQDDGSLQSTFHVAESAPHIRSLFLPPPPPPAQPPAPGRLPPRRPRLTKAGR